MGSKNRIAREIIDNLPSGEVFVDLFCGGCAVTHAALLSNKYRRFIANDINGAIPHLFKNAISGKYKDEKRWISRDDFERLKSSDPYVACCWSFGNNGQGYMYSKEIEPWKKALHWARVFGDSSLLREFGIDSDGSRKDVKSHHYEYKKKYMRWYVENVIGENWREELARDLEKKIHKQSEELRLYLCKARDDAGLKSSDIDKLLGTNGMAGHYFGRSQWEFPTRDNYEMMRTIMPTLLPYSEVYGYQELLQRLERLECLESLERLERLQSLESLERLERLQSLESLEIFTGDYRAVKIPDNAVVYCDIPYKGTAEYTAGAFDHAAFYEWALSRPFQVYVSEYSCPEGFTSVYEMKHRSILSSSANNSVTERLFCSKPMPKLGQQSLF